MGFLQRRVDDRRLGVFLCNQIESMYGATPQASLDNGLRQTAGWGAFTSQFFPPTANVPAMYWAWKEDESFFLAGGTENVTQGALLVSGYEPAAIGSPTPVVNVYVAQIAAQLALLDNARNVLNAPNVFMAGHSLGGCIAQVFASQIESSGPGTQSSLVTFGAPKVTQPSWFGRLNDTFICRWMNDDDPVPLVYPLPDQAPLIFVLTPLRISLHAARFAQIRAGRQLDVDGNITDQVLPQRAVVDATSSLAAWLVSLYQRQNSSHSITEYYRRLLLQMPPEPVQQSPHTQGSANGVIAPLDPSTIRANTTESERQLFRQSAEQSAAPLSVPQQLIFYKVKIGSSWYTAFGEEIVAIGPTRKKAGLLAQRGNEFVKLLLRQGVVDPPALVGQFQAFCDFARNPLNAISPHMRTTLGAIDLTSA